MTVFHQMRNFIRPVGQIFRDRGGASAVELALVMPLLLFITFALIEGTFALWQYNGASKATQLGGRLAAVSDPVWTELTSMTGLEGGAAIGDDFPDYLIECSGAAQTCTATTAPPGGIGLTYNSTAMDALVYGRGGTTTCGTVGVDQFMGMCDVFDRIRPANVTIEYEDSGLGFAGRPVGPVPQITVRLTGLTYDFIALPALGAFFGLNISSWTLPDFEVTMTGEDMGSSAPSF